MNNKEAFEYWNRRVKDINISELLNCSVSVDTKHDLISVYTYQKKNNTAYLKIDCYGDFKPTIWIWKIGLDDFVCELNEDGFVKILNLLKEYITRV